MMCAFCDDSCNPFIDETLGAVKIFPNSANLKAFKMGVGFSFFSCMSDCSIFDYFV